ncbi:MAG: Flp pilus assembly protein CpaB [Chromatiaceae bacterium]|nr:Flp pilus assembly protein CpaB [Gammaproteobacteria bacterium]MCP5301382.1 Flp pilus assembly protein CpaB [Chromatiaceae bacterium]MCP5306647.1 Flp pilus assembly protein CpaB [Chromatiaceae bacterium]MCP5421852.1 Flp pilus assembly protein CpaB [Chromatiaceae bacterium]
MKARTVLTLLLSLAIAGFAALVANSWINQRLLAAEKVDDVVQVVSAAVDIPVGTKIDSTHVKLISLPLEMQVQNAITSLDEALGKVASQPLYAGEILVKRRLAEFAGGSPLAAVIEPGKRALTVRVNDVIGVAGFLAPGSRVDVVSTRRPPGSTRNESETLVQNLKVLAVDQTVSSDKNDPVVVRAVTLEVRPNEAEELVKATNEGKVQLSLRNPLDDTEVVPPEPAPPVVAQVEPAPAAPAAPPRARPSGYRIDVIRGTQMSSTSVSSSGSR